MQNCYKRCKGSALPADRDKRLTTKQALAFLQDIGKENQDLKCRIEELECRLSGCQEIHCEAEMNAILVKKLKVKLVAAEAEITKKITGEHQKELMAKVEEKAEAEKQWELEKQKLLSELEKQKHENNALKRKAVDSNQDARVTELEAKVAELQDREERLTEENSRLEEVKDNQLREIQHLNCVQDQNDHLKEQLRVAYQKNKELEYKVERLERELSDTGQTEQEELMGTLRNKLTLLHNDRSQWVNREKVLETEILALKEEISKLRKALNDSERMRGDLHYQMDELLKEINALKQRTLAESNGQAFKDFVQIKREVSQLRDENKELKEKVRTRGVTTLPSLAPNGTILTGKFDRRSRESSSLSLLSWK